MGSYAHVYIGKLLFDWSKNDIESFYIRLFSSNERQVVKSSDVYLPQTVMWGYSEPFQATPNFPAVFYSTSMRFLRDRLDLLGYTLDTARECFEQSIKRLKEEQNETENIVVREVLSVDEWCAGIRELNDSLKNGGSIEEFSTISCFMYSKRDLYYGLPCDNLFVGLRLAAEALDPNELLVYDLTDIAHGGYIDADKDQIWDQLEELSESYSFQAPVVVLTEGSTDSRFIGKSLKLLYPHLADYFVFLDFSSKLAGGADELVKLLKGLIAARIPNRIIAIFDADTAARDKKRQLNQIELPSNIRVCELPCVELLQHYPSIGPDGQKYTNVHGQAASIELYFGEDVLRGTTGELQPVQWTSFIESMNSWQGEVIRKKELQNRFDAKLLTVDFIPAEDDLMWREMRAICRILLEAFHWADRKRIMSFEE